MQVRLSTAIASHLSDAQQEMSYNPDQAYQRLNFVKLLIFDNEDTSIDVTVDYLDIKWEEAAKYNRKKSSLTV